MSALGGNPPLAASLSHRRFNIQRMASAVVAIGTIAAENISAAGIWCQSRSRLTNVETHQGKAATRSRGTAYGTAKMLVMTIGAARLSHDHAERSTAQMASIAPISQNGVGGRPAQAARP